MNRQVKEALDLLLQRVRESLYSVHGTSAKLENALMEFAKVRGEHQERDVLCANLEAAALAYGEQVEKVHTEGCPLPTVNQRVLNERAYELYMFDLRARNKR